MKIFFNLLVVLCLASLTACAVAKFPMATGGSKSDGVVNMSYDVAMFEEPVVNWEAAQSQAKERCKAWGYKSAEAFGGASSECHAYNGYGNCVNSTITNAYQCTGKK